MANPLSNVAVVNVTAKSFLVSFLIFVLLSYAVLVVFVHTTFLYYSILHKKVSGQYCNRQACILCKITDCAVWSVEVIIRLKTWQSPEDNKQIKFINKIVPEKFFAMQTA